MLRVKKAGCGRGFNSHPVHFPVRELRYCFEFNLDNCRAKTLVILLFFLLLTDSDNSSLTYCLKKIKGRTISIFPIIRCSSIAFGRRVLVSWLVFIKWKITDLVPVWIVIASVSSICADAIPNRNQW